MKTYVAKLNDEILMKCNSFSKELAIEYFSEIKRLPIGEFLKIYKVSELI